MTNYSLLVWSVNSKIPHVKLNIAITPFGAKFLDTINQSKTLGMFSALRWVGGYLSVIGYACKVRERLSAAFLAVSTLAPDLSLEYCRSRSGSQKIRLVCCLI